MAEDEERPPARQRIVDGVRSPGSGLQFLMAVIGVLLIGVVIGVAMELSIPKHNGGSDPYKKPDPHWCGGCVMSQRHQIRFDALSQIGR
ncbi:MAG TPA: hypothetical protein VHC49_07740 [Mycobacteriales bacterium]|nr:hypothetical protein [Mycobacteriales bacterium]